MIQSPMRDLANELGAGPQRPQAQPVHHLQGPGGMSGPPNPATQNAMQKVQELKQFLASQGGGLPVGQQNKIMSTIQYLENQLMGQEMEHDRRMGNAQLNDAIMGGREAGQGLKPGASSTYPGASIPPYPGP